jgi:L-fuculose-phosphate aldolase
METASVRARVAEAARRLATERLVIGTAGNVSAREGDQIGGDLRPSSELGLHLGVYRRYDAGAVVHTHAPMATALSCAIDELPVVHYQMLMLGGAVRVAPYATFGTPELAEVTLDALEGRTAAMMANHGAIAHGHDLETAVEHSLLLEWACGVYWHAKAIGGPRTMDATQSQAVVDAAVERGYGTTQERTP